MTFICEFCKRFFAKERTWYNHSCEKKRRWLNRDSAQGRLAFHSWKRFHELSGMRNMKKVTQEDFISSAFYQAFNRFSAYVLENNVVAPRSFIDFVIRSNIPIDRWCQESLLVVYIRDLVNTESCDQALARSVEYLAKWAQENDQSWHDFFRLVNTNLGTQIICHGRISPWMVYNADSSMQFLERCTPEQVSMVQNWAPAHVWKIKFKNHPQDAEFAREMLAQAGM